MTVEPEMQENPILPPELLNGMKSLKEIDLKLAANSCKEKEIDFLLNLRSLEKSKTLNIMGDLARKLVDDLVRADEHLKTILAEMNPQELSSTKSELESTTAVPITCTAQPDTILIVKPQTLMAVAVAAEQELNTLDTNLLNEPTYCLCGRPEFGEMIACDMEACRREWFHYECVGLVIIPEGKWFCPECKIKRD